MIRSLLTAVALGALLAAPVRVAADMAPMVGMHDDAHMQHMALSPARAARPGDAERAVAILAAARTFMAAYADPVAAERAGFAKFAPSLKLPIEHYTNNANAVKAALGKFDAAQPTSLIYARTGESLKLVGVMYTANARANDDTLDAAVPLSVARWHRHVNFCFKAGQEAGLGGDKRFGMGGSIETEEACAAAGGRWQKQLFGWMVHAWPLETDPKKQWAVEEPNGKGAMANGMRM